MSLCHRETGTATFVSMGISRYLFKSILTLCARKPAPKPLPGLTAESEAVLRRLSFRLVKSWDHGRYKFYQWNNRSMTFQLYHETGYFDAQIHSRNQDRLGVGHPGVLKFLKNDPTFLAEELNAAGRAGTLEINRYVELLGEHYDTLKQFVSRGDSKKGHAEYREFFRIHSDFEW